MLEAENVEPGDSSTPTTADAPRGEQTAPATDAPADAPAEPGADAPVKKAAAKRATAKKTAAKKTTAKKAPAKRATKKAAAAPVEPAADETLLEVPAAEVAAPVEDASVEAPAEATGAPAEKKPAKKTAKKAAAKKAPAKRAAKKTAGTPEATLTAEVDADELTDDLNDEATSGTLAAPADQAAPAEETVQVKASAPKAGPPAATALLFQPPDPTKAVVTRRRRPAKPDEAEGEGPAGEEQQKPAKKAAQKPAKKAAQKPAEKAAEAEELEEPQADQADTDRQEGDDEQGGERRRRRRGGRRRRRSGGGEDGDSAESTETGDQSRGDQSRGDQSRGDQDESSGDDEQGDEAGSGSRRRRRRRRSGDSSDAGPDEPENTVTRVRKGRTAEDEITALSGSTRLEAKKQRRREGREAGRRRAPIVSEAEFLARRESVDRVMVIRQRKDLTQIAVMEDKVLVEHYVSRESQTSLIGNVYLGRVQNVLPSMEAAFIDIGKGRNAVLYAGEVNWDALGAKNGQPRKIESVLKSGQPILVQVTKDPIGHKGARLTSQISLPGRFLVYVPDGTTSGISRKLPDTERNRLKTLLKEIVPDSAGVIVRTAAEGASEDELTRDVERLTARWNDIEEKAKSGNAPQMLYGEPDLTLKVVRDLFTEDFGKLVIAGDDAWDMVQGYVDHVAPDLADRLEKYDGERDVFAEYRIDEQIEKALDRKVWLPSGGSLVIDRTEAMTVVDVNTGKFTGSGGNLEETVTKNNLEAAEEIVRQLRLRDIGGIIVVDFIDMVLESNRDLVLRRLVECLGRDRTRHQVAEVTSLGLVQMTRKRIGTGLLEAFSESCEHCQGRGLVLHHEPVEPKKKADDEPRRGRRSGRGRGRDESGNGGGNGGGVPSPKDIAAMARHDEETDGSEPSPDGAAAKADEKALDKGTDTSADQGSDKGPDRAAEKPEQAEAREAEAAPGAESSADGEERPSGRSRSRGGRGRGRKTAQAEPGTPSGDQQETQSQDKVETGGDAEAQAPSEDVQTAAEQPQPVQEPAEESAPQPAEAAAEAAAETGSEEVAEEAAPAEPAAPAAPKIVTSVRRRGARRAAGPPPGATSTAAAVLTASADTASADTDGVSPDGAAADGAAPAGETGEAASPEGAEHESTGTPHVPVKKRGSRRR